MTLSLHVTLRNSVRTAAVVLAGALLLGCGGDEEADPDTATDTGADLGVDTAPEPDADAGSDATPEPDAPTTPTLAEVSSTIFTPTCATVGCHGTTFPQGGLVLTDGNDLLDRLLADSTIGMPQITPGDPANSYLFLKVTGEFLDVGGSGTRMPSGAPLSESQTDLLRRWILEGPELADR